MANSTSPSSNQPNNSEAHSANEPEAKYLHRSTSNQILGGVAGGLGEYFSIDPTIIRLAFVLLAFANGAGILLYLVMWLIMPETNTTIASGQDQFRANAEQIGATVKRQTDRLTSEDSRHIWGWVLVVLGAVILVANQGLFNMLDWDLFWPVVLILLGLFFLLRRK